MHPPRQSSSHTAWLLLRSDRAAETEAPRREMDGADTIGLAGQTHGGLALVPRRAEVLESC